MNKRSTVRRARPLAWLHPTAVVLVTVVVIGVPLSLVVLTAGKTRGEALNPDFTLPEDFQLGTNLATVWRQGEVPRAFLGSMGLVLPTVLLLLFAGSMAAWVLARRSGRVNTVLYATGISGIVLPPAVVTIVLLLRQLGLAGTAIGMICVYVGVYMSTVIFFVTGFVRSIPIELEEAARMDGAGPVRTFFQVIAPMLSPVLSSAAILISLYVWNDVFYALFVVAGRIDTLPLNLFSIASAELYLNNWHLIFAYIILASLPLLTIFAVAQRWIISGVTGGAVK